MNENLKNSNKSIKEIKNEYVNNPKIDLIKFLREKDLDILKKFGIEVQNKSYTEYEYQIIEMKLYDYYKKYDNPCVVKNKKLIQFGINKKQYEEILDIFNKISSYYNL